MINGSSIQSIIYQGQQVASVYRGGSLIWQAASGTPECWIYLETSDGAAATVNLNGTGYSVNSGEWWEIPDTALPLKWLNTQKTNVTSVDLSRFDSPTFNNMNNMFQDCSALASVNLQGFDTSNVIAMSFTFKGCSGLTSLDVSGFDTSNVTGMVYTFGGCSGLTSLDVSGFDTSKVTTMAYMFWNCSHLTSLDVSGFNTSSVAYMTSMFQNCQALTSLDVSGFDTSNVNDMGSMFWYCQALTSLDVSGFDTSNVTGMGGMFQNCRALTSLDVSGFDTSNVTYMGSMFQNCSALTSLDVSGFDTSNVTYMGSMFGGCSGLTSLDVSGFDTSNVTGMGSMFYGCSGLTSLDVSGFDTANVTGMGGMFSGCSHLTSLDLSSFDTSSVTSMGSMFGGCSALTTLNLPEWDFSNADSEELSNIMEDYEIMLEMGDEEMASMVMDMVYNLSLTSMFSGCSSLTTVTGPISGLSYTFKLNDCPLTRKSALVFINGLADLTGKTAQTVSFSEATCALLTASDVAIAAAKNWNVKCNGNDFTPTATEEPDYPENSIYVVTSDASTVSVKINSTSYRLNSGEWWELPATVTNLGSMMKDEDKLTECICNFDTSNVTNITSMFNGCSALTSLDVSGFDTSSVTGMSSMFFGCSALTTLDLSSFDTSNVEYIACMFQNCSALTSLDLSNFDTSSVTNITCMFYGCSSLTSLNLSGWDLSSLMAMNDLTSMFFRCSALTTVTGPISGINVSFDLNDSPLTRESALVFINGLADLTGNTAQTVSFSTTTCALLTASDVAIATAKNWNVKCNGNDFTPTATDYPDNSIYVVTSDGSAVTAKIRYDSYTLNSGEWWTVPVPVKATSLFEMMKDNDKLTECICNFDSSNATMMGSMFNGCSALTSLDLSSFDTSSVTSMGSMFSGCSALTSLDLSNFDTSSVTGMGMGSMFNGCSSLTSLDLSSFNTANVTEMDTMFCNCSALTSLDLSNFDTSSLTSTITMFSWCTALTTLNLSGWDFSGIGSLVSMFNKCSSLTTVTGPISGISVNLELYDSPLTRDSAMVFINGLATVSSTKTIRFKSATYALLSSSDIALATSKGWTVASLS